MTSQQLQKTTRNWQGLSDPIACRGSFSSPRGAYPLSRHFPATAHPRNHSDACQSRGRMVAWLQQNEGAHSTPAGPDTPLDNAPSGLKSLGDV